ncbi:Engulfment and cell motility protein 3 [Tyrophagus putrescentiae]|nr:Engulfment and cell motility protein 3 [Tyrophagus putrescentiae]
MATIISKSQQGAENFLKIAVVPYRELEQSPKKDNQPPWILFSYNPKQDLESIIESVCLSFQLNSSSSPSSGESGTPYPRYITEENRNEEITNGALVQLYYSPRRLTTLREILEHSADPAFVVEFDAQGGLKWLMSSLQAKNTFTVEEQALALEIFLRTMEHDIVHWTSVDKAFIDCVATNIYSRADLNSTSGTSERGGDSLDHERKLLITSLAILEAAVISCPGKFVAEIERQITLPSLNQLLKNDRLPAVQQNVLALINAILARTDANRRRAMAATLTSRQFKDTILQYVVNKKQHNDTDSSSKGSMGSSEITHQLYVLQTHLLHFYDDKRQSGAAFDDARDKVKEIRAIYAQTMERDGIGMETTSSSSHSGRSASQANIFRSQSSLASNSSGASGASGEKSHSEDYERFGFANTVHPWETFYDPPGALVLDCLHYYAKAHTDDFVRYGDRQHDCPLVVAAGELVRLLLALLGMGGEGGGGGGGSKNPLNINSETSPGRLDQHHFYPMLFDGERPFEELFSIGLSLFNRTWHEIHATAADMGIVESFLAEKLRKTLASSSSNSATTSCFDSFKKEVMKISYAEINRRWNEERDRRDRQKEELPVIKELKGLLRPEMVGIVRAHRLNYLVRGTRFDKYTAKGQRVKDKFWYCRLSSNHKTLLYGDCDEDIATRSSGLEEVLTSKFNIADIETILVGRECPHMRDSKGGKKSTTSALAFALVSKGSGDDDGGGGGGGGGSTNGFSSTASVSGLPRSLCFVASNGEIYDCWVDGLSALLDRPMVSSEAEKDAQMLLELDIKLRLLDIEGISIPERAPEVPPPPANYDFALKNGSGGNGITS